MWGALRPVEQLQAIFGYRNAHLFPERVFIPVVNDHLTPEGRLGNQEHPGPPAQPGGGLREIRR